MKCEIFNVSEMKLAIRWMGIKCNSMVKLFFWVGGWEGEGEGGDSASTFIRTIIFLSKLAC